MAQSNYFVNGNSHWWWWWSIKCNQMMFCDPRTHTQRLIIHFQFISHTHNPKNQIKSEKTINEIHYLFIIFISFDFNEILSFLFLFPERTIMINIFFLFVEFKIKISKTTKQKKFYNVYLISVNLIISIFCDSDKSKSDNDDDCHMILVCFFSFGFT